MSQRSPFNNPPNNAFNNPGNMGSDDQAARALQAAAIAAEEQRHAYWLTQSQENKNERKMDEIVHQQQHQAQQRQHHQAEQQAHQQQQRQQQRAQPQLQHQQQARQPPNDQVVIMIDDDSEDSNEDEAATNTLMPPRITNRELKRHREIEADGRLDPPAQKCRRSQSHVPEHRPSQPPPSRLSPDGSHPLPPGYSPVVTQAPAVARNADGGADKWGPLAGPFVSGVLSGRLFTIERENNRKNALSNALLFVTGHTQESAPEGMIFPPPTVQLNIRQVQALTEGFLDDRENAVNEAVRIAYMEMKCRHEEIALRRYAVDSSDIKVLKAEMERMKKEHVKEEKRLSDKVKSLKSLYNKQRKARKLLQQAMDKET